MQEKKKDKKCEVAMTIIDAIHVHRFDRSRIPLVLQVQLGSSPVASLGVVAIEKQTLVVLFKNTFHPKFDR